jgi:peptidoglycan/xylan/chitin deacetylase (PgdA/CDA1 family)
LDYFTEQLLVDSKNKLMVLTFDDGYVDNFTEAYPLLKRMGIPFTIFVTTSFPDGEAVLWWYAIERLLLGNDTIFLANGHMLPAHTNQEKLDAFFFLRQLIMSLPRDEFGDRVNALFKETSFDWRQMCAAEALSWSDLCEMARDPLVTIGAHTVSHPVLSALTPERACLEMRESRELLEARIGVNVAHFCYPFGSRGEVGVREFELAKKLGFKTATTTRWGNIFKKHRDHLHGLPRVPLTNTFNWDDFRQQSLRRFLKGRVVSI